MGPAGPIGPTGPAGSTLDFFEAYATTFQNIVSTGDVAFNASNVVGTNISWSSPTTATLGVAGTYYVRYVVTVVSTTGTVPAVLAVMLNGAELPASRRGIVVAGSNSIELQGDALFTATAGSTLSLSNRLGSTLQIDNFGAGQTTSASVVVQRVQ
jgi:hypothetical protein